MQRIDEGAKKVLRENSAKILDEELVPYVIDQVKFEKYKYSLLQANEVLKNGLDSIADEHELIHEYTNEWADEIQIKGVCLSVGVNINVHQFSPGKIVGEMNKNIETQNDASNYVSTTTYNYNTICSEIYFNVNNTDITYHAEGDHTIDIIYINKDHYVAGIKKHP